jgi:anti-anti-sigma regulatory factor
MNMTTSQQQGNKPVTIIHLDGKLDSDSFQSLIDEAKKLYTGGARHLLLDMTKLTYISSAGIVALQSIANLFRGEPLPDLEAGWHAIRSLDKERVGGKQQNVKLLNLSPEVWNVLDMVGIADFFETFTDLAQAVASF